MSKPFAIVTGASSGIGLELATICAQEGFDLLIAADRPEIHTALRQIEIVLKGNVTESTQLRFKRTGGAARTHHALDTRESRT